VKPAEIFEIFQSLKDSASSRMGANSGGAVPNSS